ncbi:MAG: CDP-alcohol phosphatidyltransferase [Chitinophagaceae bacterium]|nr:CDP-alcohol phosphatidyltransferase [Chitinophagaceae bacterium]
MKSFAAIAILAGIAGMSFKQIPDLFIGHPMENECHLDTLPVPPLNKNMLFYLQRTTNKNTVVYELNLKEDGSLDEEEPVHPYWIRYTEDGGKAELSYIQRNYAYGLHAVLTDKKANTYKLNFVSYGKLDIYLMKSTADQAYHTYVKLDGKLIMLQKIFVRIEGGTFWFPHVPYVDITGKDTGSGKLISHRFIP